MARKRRNWVKRILNSKAMNYILDTDIKVLAAEHGSNMLKLLAISCLISISLSLSSVSKNLKVINNYLTNLQLIK